MTCRSLYNTVLIGRIILTWFPSAPQAIVQPLSTVTDPYLNLFRYTPHGGGRGVSISRHQFVALQWVLQLDSA